MRRMETEKSLEINSQRLRIGETQAEFAKHFGVNQSTIHRWETEGIPRTGRTRILIDLMLPKIRRMKPRIDSVAAE